MNHAPTHWSRPSRKVSCLAALSVSLLVACSSTDSTTSTTKAVPPTLSLTKITPVGAPAWAPGGNCVERGHDAEGSVAVQARITDAELRAPGTCGSRAACGHLQFSIASADYSQDARSSSASYTFSLADAPLGVVYTFSVTLADDDGVALEDADGNALTVSSDVELSAPGACGGEPDPEVGSDAGTGSDAGADAGTSADAGMDADAGADGGPDAG
ncbi:MAG: hypothetical protein AB7K71_12100 [Polyangiaceae bacterium]